MSKKNQPKMSIILSTILVCSVLASCGGTEELTIIVPPGAKAGDLSMEPCTHEAGDLEFAADCGTLVVPENRSEPTSRLIALPVTRIRTASDKPAEPVFFLSGGPGETNMRNSRVSWFVEQRDFVLVGYRGVDVLVLPGFR